jgi:hypothetical protein
LQLSSRRLNRKQIFQLSKGNLKLPAMPIHVLITGKSNGILSPKTYCQVKPAAREG